MPHNIKGLDSLSASQLWGDINTSGSDTLSQTGIDFGVPGQLGTNFEELTYQESA
jgi:hypothetical protein